jgi:hypothetical protein
LAAIEPILKVRHANQSAFSGSKGLWEADVQAKKHQEAHGHDRTSLFVHFGVGDACFSRRKADAEERDFPGAGRDESERSQ